MEKNIIDGLSGGEIIGLGAVALSLIGIIYKIWVTNSKLTERVIDVVEKNAISHEKLTAAVNRVAEATNENTGTTRKLNDTISELTLKIIRDR